MKSFLRKVKKWISGLSKNLFSQSSDSRRISINKMNTSEMLEIEQKRKRIREVEAANSIEWIDLDDVVNMIHVSLEKSAKALICQSGSYAIENLEIQIPLETAIDQLNRRVKVKGSYSLLEKIQRTDETQASYIKLAMNLRSRVFQELAYQSQTHSNGKSVSHSPS